MYAYIHGLKIYLITYVSTHKIRPESKKGCEKLPKLKKHYPEKIEIFT